jgi:hypothetical protein
MIRWILLLALIGLVYWIYERDYAKPGGSSAPTWRTTESSATLPPGGRLGGGLNPFVTDDGVDTAPQRPKAP